MISSPSGLRQKSAKLPFRGSNPREILRNCMYKLYLKSVIEVWPTSSSLEDSELIAELILFDVSEKSFYMIRNENAKLIDAGKRLISRNDYVKNIYEDSFIINEINFNYLLNHQMDKFYTIKKNDLLTQMNLEEQVI